MKRTAYELCLQWITRSKNYNTKCFFVNVVLKRPLSVRWKVPVDWVRRTSAARWAEMLHIYLRNRPHLDTAKGYWVSVSVIGPLRLQRGMLLHVNLFQFPVSLQNLQYNPIAFFLSVFLIGWKLSLESTNRSSGENQRGSCRQVVIQDYTLFIWELVFKGVIEFECIAVLLSYPYFTFLQVWIDISEFILSFAVSF